jgi:hypothetical protein
MWKARSSIALGKALKRGADAFDFTFSHSALQPYTGCDSDVMPATLLPYDSKEMRGQLKRVPMGPV